jgi:anti-sigma factor RsiW
MACERSAELMLLVDGELRGFEARTLEAHAGACAECGRELTRLRALSAAIARDVPRIEAPPALRRRVERALRPHPARAPLRNWTALAAALLVGAMLGSGITWGLLQPSVPTLDSAVAAHVDALMSNRLIEVASSDQHTVRPWFAGKVPVAPPVPDLAQAGFTLLGGRVDEIGGQKVGAVVYRRRQHLIDLFVAPRGVPTAQGAVGRGYNIVSWTADGLAFAAVSDLNATELQEFATRIRASR